MKCIKSLSALASAVALATTLVGSADAAVIRIESRIENAFDTGFNPLPAVPDLSFYTAGVPIVLQVDYHVVVDSTLPGERGFGSTGFNVVLNNGLTEVGGGWASNTATTDSNGAAPGGIVPLFSTNADAGPSNSDLQGIFASIAGGISNPNASDNRVKLGQPGGPSLLGSVFVQWDGTTTTTIDTLGVEVVSYTLTGQFGPTLPSVTAPILLVAIPQPSTVALGGLGLASIVAFRRRRQA